MTTGPKTIPVFRFRELEAVVAVHRVDQHDGRVAGVEQLCLGGLRQFLGFIHCNV